MIEQPRRRPPLPIVAVALTTALVAVAVLVSAMASSGSSRIIGSMTALLVLGLAYGLWRGSGRARFWASVSATASAVYAVVPHFGVDASGLFQFVVSAVFVGLLLVPASSREWFHAPSAP
ncbi:hypothetical protein [Micromonospora endolithica]|uniref:Uncharacterized protein n=1 Tax=Micromonospora endolithica TaxID=230091 RepID=A0A3A9Z0V1_9ACTN|nr:hypothetical protein [Micromonospora endolithica]RKN42082.1 hypothetical protein D7223_23355 [Micromonospora endolithica]TWJ26324.1 hypothetical protein JD76_06505 [Micromonospora endolithica]